MCRIPKTVTGEETHPIATETIAFRPDDNDENWFDLDWLVGQIERFWRDHSPTAEEEYMTPDAAELWGWF